jgi:RNA polymerase sigma-70 factor (ECF subfamily)
MPWRVVPTRANGQLAFAHYHFDPDDAAYRLGNICLLMLEGDRMKEITAFHAPAAFASFDLPETLGGESNATPDPTTPRTWRRP